jgi:hypothetical protein
VSDPQIISTIVLVVLLLAWAGYSGWRQVQTLRALPAAENLPPDDLRYLRSQAWLRLTSSGLMVALATLLALSFFVEKPAQALIDENNARREQQSKAYATIILQNQPIAAAACSSYFLALPERGEEAEDTPEHRRFVKFYGAYWISVLLLLLGMVGIALYDMLAIRRFGQRHYRKIQEDRRAMIARQVARMRRDRNGHN